MFASIKKYYYDSVQYFFGHAHNNGAIFKNRKTTSKYLL